MPSGIKITETPRDGFQALSQFIPTQRKVDYINRVLHCGFDTVEVGSFVSPRAIPQMADTGEVLNALDLSSVQSKIAVLTATVKGAKMACEFEQVDKIFYPFSLSETFLLKNIKQTVHQAEQTIDEIINISKKHGKEVEVYYSWGFGDPYGDPWSVEMMVKSVEMMASKGLNYFPLSDIAGEVSSETISTVFKTLFSTFPNLDFGFHLHALPKEQLIKIEAAFNAGVRSFDSVIGGMGGCPMTGKELVANMDTQLLIDFFKEKKANTGVNKSCVAEAGVFLSTIV